MVAIVSGSALGVSLSSWATLGQQGQIGTPGLGQTGEQTFVNVATGNLVLQDRDDVFMSMGAEVGALRTYNSQGLLDDDNGDNWTSGIFKGGNLRFTGTLNAAGSVVYRTDQDGAEAAYAWNSATSSYVTLKGSGAYDTFMCNATTKVFTWTDGDSGATETYQQQIVNGKPDMYRLMSRSDAQGHTLTYTYDSLGQLQKVQSSRGDAFTFNYNGTTKLASVVYSNYGSSTSTTVRYGYHATTGKLISVTVDLSPDDNSVADAKTYTTTYAYDAGGRLASTTQADGTRLSFGYTQGPDGVYRVTSITDGLNQVTTYNYDTTNRQTTVMDAQGRWTTYAYDAAGKLTSVKTTGDGGWQTTSFGYSAATATSGERLISITDPMGQQVVMDYDARGNQVLQRDAAGNTIKRTFDAYNQLVTETLHVVPDPDGVGAGQPSQPLVTRYVYDGTSQHLLRFVLSAEGRVTEYRYNGDSQRAMTIAYAQDTYPVAGLGATAVPALGDLQSWASSRQQTAAHTTYQYDSRGQLWTQTQWSQVYSNGDGFDDGQQSVTTYVRDRSGRLLQTVTANGTSSNYTYDGLGRILTATNAQNELTTYAYDAANNKIRVTQANGLITTSAYDKGGRLVSVTQGSATVADLGTTRYFYDAAGRLAMTQDPTSVRSWKLYDEAGRLVADIDGDGRLTEYRYNADNLVTHTIAYAQRVSTASLVDGSGQPTNPSLSDIRPGSGSADQHTWRMYDAANRLVKSVDATGAVTQTDYDGAGRVVAVTRFANRIGTAGLGDQPAASQVAPQISWTDDRTSRNYYDADGLLRAAADAEGCVIQYQYDAAGRLARSTRHQQMVTPATTLADIAQFGDAQDAVTTYLYNLKGQVAGEIDAEGYLTEKVYDKSGNLAQSIRYANKVTAYYEIGSQMDDVRPASSPLDQSNSWQYDGLNRVTQQTDWQGTVTQFTYDNAGNRVKTVKALGQPEARTLQARYDIQGRLVGELTAEGSAKLTGNQTPAEIDAIWAQWGLTHTYDTAGRRTSTTDQYGNKTLFFYNPDNQLTHTVNALGEVTETQYDGLGRRTAIIKYGTRIGLAGLTGSNAGGLVNTSLAAAINLVKSDTKDSKTAYTYLSGPWEFGVIETDALGFETTRSTNAFGQDYQVSRSLGADSSYTEIHLYDRRGLETSWTHSGSTAYTRTRYEYDAFGRVTKTIDGNNETRWYEWDKLGRQVSVTDPLDATSYTAYDAFDRVATQTDALGAVTRYAYDNNLRSISVTSPEGIVTTTVSTRFGQQQSVTDGRGNATTYLYDLDGKLKQVTRADQSTEITAYDRAGRIAETTDANGNKVAFSYDAANRMFTRTVDPVGLNLVTTYTWDEKGQQLTTTSPNRVVTRFAYDLKGQLKTQTVDPGGLNLVTAYTYDGASNVLTVTSPAGTVTQYGYDSLGRRVKEQVDPSGLNLTRYWEYDATGLLVSSTDANGELTLYIHDDSGRLVYTVDPNGAVLENVYDAAGRIVRTVRYAQPLSVADANYLYSWPSRGSEVLVSDPQDVVQERVLDKDGRLLATVDGTGAVVKYTYDANGNVIDRRAYANKLNGWTPGTVPNPTPDNARDQRIRTVYDKLNRAIYTVDGTGAVVATQYDGNGNVVQRKAYAQQIPVGTAATESAITLAVNQVADANRDMLLRQVYDKAGRLAYSVDGVGAVTKRTYDADGNLRELKQFATPVGAGADPASATASASDRTTTYTWDKAGRNTYVTDALGGIVKNDYDGNGRLTLRRAYAGASPDDANDRIDRFAYDTAGRLAYAVDATGAATLTEYDGVGRVVRTTAFARPLTQANLLALPTTGRASDVAALVTRNTAQDRTTQQVFDPAGELVYTIDAAGYVRENRYDGLGRVSKTILYSVSPALGAQPTLEAVRTALAGDPASRTDGYTYDAAGRLRSSTDSLNYTEFYDYDGVGNKKTFKNKKGDVWTYDYDAAGRMVRETSPAVVPAVAVLDNQGALTSLDPSRVAQGIVTVLAYDALGNLTARTEAAGLPEQRTTSYQYDALGRQVKTLYPQVGVYDAVNDKLTMVGLAARSETTPPLSTSTVYDTLGNAIAGQDLAGNWSYKLYDRLGRVRYEVDAMGYVAGYTRNAFGEATDLARYANPVSVTPAGPQGFTQQDVLALGQLLATTSSPARHLQTQYDQRGRVAKVTEPAVTTYSTDVATNAGTPLLTSRATTNTYNAFGDLVRTVVGNGSQSATTDHFYDRRGQEVGTVDAMGYLTTQAYDEAGLLKTRTEYATSVGGGNWGGQPVSATAPAAPAASDDDRKTGFTYDALGRKTGETRYNVQTASGTPLQVASAQGVASVTTTPQPQTMTFAPVPPGVQGIPSVVFFSGADGSGVLRWPAPPANVQTVLRWRPSDSVMAQAWQSVSDLVVTDTDGTQHLAIAADMPAGGYDVELTYEMNGLPINRVTGQLTIPGPLMNVQLTGMSGAVQATTRPIDGKSVWVLQWSRPAAGSVASLQFQAPGSSDWQSASVTTDGAVQYVVIPQGLPSGSYALRFGISTMVDARVDATTQYDYDAVGNLVRTKDAAGGETFSYYDALGRVKAVVTPAVNTGTAQLTPLTEYFRDAFGNVVGTAERALGAAAGASIAGYTSLGGSIADHIQGFAYDRFGHMTQSTDAGQVNHYYSYNERGDLAKTWQKVTDSATSAVYTLWQQMLYDKLGRLVSTKEPGPTQLDGSTLTTTTVQAYNAYGEMTRRTVDGKVLEAEYFDYDDAGRLWRTNTGDGVDRVMLYDVLGNMTLELRSDGTGGSNINLAAAVGNADAALALAPSLRQALTFYDKLGHAIRQVLPQKLDAATGVGVMQAFATSVITQAGTLATGTDYQPHWELSNKVGLQWTNLTNLGSGEIKVELGYTTKEDSRTIAYPQGEVMVDRQFYRAAAARTVTRMFTAEEAASGVNLEWNDDDSVAGIDKITSLKVYKKDINGQWVAIYNQGATSNPVNAVYIAKPQDMGAALPELGTSVTLEVRLAGSGNGWEAIPMTDFGSKLFFNAAGLNGVYEYRVLTQRQDDTAPAVTSTGTIDLAGAVVALIDTPIVTGAEGNGVYYWLTPAGSDVVQTFRYRLVGTTAWQSLPVQSLGDGNSGVSASVLANGSYEYELSYAHAGSTTPYAHTTGQLSVTAASGTPPIVGRGFEASDDGTAVMKWLHVPGTTSVLTYSLAGSGTAPVPVPWKIEDMGDYMQVTSPNTLAPGLYNLDLKLVGADSVVVAHSAYTLTVAIGATQTPTCPPAEPKIAYKAAYTEPAVGTPPVDQVQFIPQDNGDWTLTWPVVAGRHTEMWMIRQGTTDPVNKTSQIQVVNGVATLTVKDQETPAGLWNVELRQYSDTDNSLVAFSAATVTTYLDTKIPPVLEVTTPPYNEQQGYPIIDTSWTANADGTWSINWTKSADTTVTAVTKWRVSTGSKDWALDSETWSVGTVGYSGSTASVGGSSVPPVAGQNVYDVAVFEVKNGVVVRQSLRTITIHPGTYAAATAVYTTPAYTPAYTWSVPSTYIPNVPGITWASGTSSSSSAPGSTFTWDTPPAGYTTSVNYRLRGSGTWKTADPAGFQPLGGKQMLYVYNSATFGDGVWDVQITQFNTSTGAVLGIRTGTMTVSGNGTAHQLASTYKGIAKFGATQPAGGGTIISWQPPPAGYTTTFVYHVAGAPADQWSEAIVGSDGKTQSVSIGAGWNPGSYQVQVQLKDSTGAVIQLATADVTLTSTGYGNTFTDTTPGNTVISSSPAIGVKPFTVNMSSNAADGSWSLQWTKPTNTQPTLRYKLTGSNNWTTATSKITSTSSTSTASFSGLDLPAGLYEFDIFYGSDASRTWQCQGTVTINSNPPSAATFSDRNVQFVAASGIPVIPVTYSPPNPDVWRFTWPAALVGQTEVFKVIDPTGAVMPSITVQTDTDGTRYFIGPVNMDAGTYKLDLKFLNADGSVAKQASANLTFAQNDTKASIYVADTGYKPPVFHPQEGYPPLDGVQFVGRTDGSWTLSWPHPVAGTVVKLQFRMRGTGDFLTALGAPDTANGRDSYTFHAWDYPPGGVWDMVLYSEDAQGNRLAESLGTLTMAPMGTVKPVLGELSMPGYTAGLYLVTQQAGKASQSYVPVGPQTPLPGIAWQPAADGGTRFVWNSKATAEDVFRYRVAGTTQWNTIIPGAINETGTPQSVVYIAGTFPVGQYEVQLTRTEGGIVTGAMAGNMFVVAKTEQPAGTTTITQPTSSNTAAPVLQATVNRSYDRWGNVLSVSDARYAGWVTRYTYNANNQLVAQLQPDGNGNADAAKTSILYDVLGRQVAVIDANGNMNRQEWDAAGNLVAERHADGGDITYRYDVFGNKVQAVARANASPTGSYTTDYGYDRMSRLTSTTYAAVDASHYTVDANGNYTLSNDGTQVRLTEAESWDEAGRKTKHTGTDGLETSYRYDLRGNVIQSVEGGVTTQMAYDAQGRLTARRDGLGATATWSYDYFGQLKGHVDIGGASYTYVYDNARQLTAQSNDRVATDYQMRQDLRYEYDRAGNLVTLTDASTNTVQSFSYDLAGHRVREKTVSQGITYRDNYLAYDALGRLKLVEDGRAQVIMDYDGVGNRTRIETHVITAQAAGAVGSQVEGRHDSDDYFRYDAMNRQVLANGNADGTLGADGHRITYDWLGNKTSDSWQGKVVSVTSGTSYTTTVDGYNDTQTYTYTTPAVYHAQLGETTESYSYDALGRLKTINRDGTTVESRSYDKAGRLTQSGAAPGTLSQDYFSALYGTSTGNQPLPGNGTELKKNAYDANGRLMHQQVLNSAGDKQYELDYRNADKTKANYDDAGNLQGYKLNNIQGQAYTNTYTYDYLKLEGYQEKTVTATRGDQTTQSWKHYDGNGGLREAADQGQTGSYRWFVNDEAGRALYVNQGDHIQRELIVNGEVLGRYGEVVDDTKPKTAGSPSFTTVADFNFAFMPTAGNTPQMQERSHAVSAGDTLQSIAKSYYGDERLWYRIADANGVSGNDNLTPGQVLKVPALETTGNAANTFRPYEPSSVQGDSTPYLPAPAPKKKSFLGQFLALVVTIVVAIYTAGAMAAAGMFGEGVAATAATAGGAAIGTGAGLTGATFAAGGAVLGGAAGAGAAAAAGIVSAAAGSIAGQAVGIATGAQDSFSWRSVAMSAISGGISGGLTNWAPFDGAALGNAMARAAVGNAATQGIAIVTGLQQRFDWRGVAASAVGAGVGQAVGQAVGNAVGGTDWSPFAKEFVTRGAAGFAGGVATAVARGGKVAVQQIATDAFGSALSWSLIGQLPSLGGDQDDQARQAAQENFRAGEISRQNADAYQQGVYGQLVDTFGRADDYAARLKMVSGALLAQGSVTGGILYDSGRPVRGPQINLPEVPLQASLPPVEVREKRMTPEEEAEFDRVNGLLLSPAVPVSGWVNPFNSPNTTQWMVTGFTGKLAGVSVDQVQAAASSLNLNTQQVQNLRDNPGGGNVLQQAWNSSEVQSVMQRSMVGTLVNGAVSAIGDAIGGARGYNPVTNQFYGSNEQRNAMWRIVANIGLSAELGGRTTALRSPSSIATAEVGELSDLIPQSSLSNRQRALHELLTEPGAYAVVRKRSVSMQDLTNLSRVTGDEYSMFTKKGERLIIRGDGNTVAVSPEMFLDLTSGAYGRFSGHTHPPGYSVAPGPGDRPFLSQMGQERSTIWGSNGERYTFGQIGIADDERIAAEISRKKWQTYFNKGQ